MRAEPADPLIPLLLATALLLLSVIVPRLRPGWPLWVRVLARIMVLALMTLLVERVLGSPLRPRYGNRHEGEQFWEQLIVAGWWIAVAQVAVGFARLLVVLENKPRESRIVSDLMAGVIYVATALAVIDFAFAVPIRGLLATSGVIAIVLGLALQSTLSDVFSGIAVGLERPYKPGDLLWVEGGIEGHVIQVNWRATQIATPHNNTAVVPNSIMAKSRLINRSAPSEIRGDTVTVALDSGIVPDRCIAALTTATIACRVMLPEPAPSIGCTGLRGDGATYEIGFSVASSKLLTAARKELFVQIHRHLHHSGINFAIAGIAPPPAPAAPTTTQLLAQSELFGLIAAGDRDLLATHFVIQSLAAGETLIREGEQPESLFLLASGVVEITRAEQGGPHVVYRLSPGESLGAIGLITGAPYMATAIALTHVVVHRLAKNDIAAAIRISPELAVGLEALATRGQERIRQEAAAREDAELEHPELFLGRLRSFLRRLSG